MLSANWRPFCLCLNVLTRSKLTWYCLCTVQKWQFQQRVQTMGCLFWALVKGLCNWTQLYFVVIFFPFSDFGLDYLGFRFYIGLWVMLILIIIVMFDLSALVRYITRFTEESFAALIALIFIVEAFKKLFHIMDHAAVNFHPHDPLDYTCDCQEPNSTSKLACFKIKTVY